MKRQHWIILLIIALIVGGIFFYNRGTRGRNQPGEQPGPGQVQDGDTEEPDDNGEDERLSLSNYFLTDPGLRLSFSGEGYAHADRITWVAHTNNNIVQHMEQSAATTIAKVYDVSDTEIVLIFAQEEVYDEEDYTEVGQRNRSKSILRSPIEVGNTWEDDEMTYEIEAVDEPLTVPYGTFETIRVRERNIDGESESVNYYAVKYGLIKSIFTGENYEVIIQLESVEE